MTLPLVMTVRADLRSCNHSSALTLAVIKLLEKHWECYWLYSNCACVQPPLRHPSINIMTLCLSSSLSNLLGGACNFDFLKSLEPNLGFFSYTALHIVSSQDGESPEEQLLREHLILLVTSGDKCTGISLKKEYFEQESIMLRDSTEFIFHFDCLKDAIKKHLPVGSDGNGMGTEGKRELFFN